jgi:hypothetical protein
MHLDTIIQRLYISLIPLALWSRYDNGLLHLFSICLDLCGRIIFLNTVEAAHYNCGCYQSAIVITISGPKTLHLKSIKNKPFIIINLLVIVIKLQIIRVHI